MNQATDPIPQIISEIAQKNSGLICLPENPQVDSISSAVSLYQALTKLGKNVSIVCGTKPAHSVNGADKIQSSLATAGNNLVISLPYTDGSIDKVDYNIQGNHFNLIVTPKEGFPKLNAQEVQYSYTGGGVDFIITIDSPSLKNLGSIYHNNIKQFEGKTIINIDRRLTNSYYGTVNLVSKASSSTSEIILKLLNALQTEIDREIATNLYAGLTAATNNFTSYSVNAQTFETAAYLLKLGAVKKAPARPGALSSSQRFSQPYPPSNGLSNISTSGSHHIEQEKQVIPQKPVQENSMPEQTKPIEEVEQEVQVSDSNETPEDWLKPKIFKGGSNLL